MSVDLLLNGYLRNADDWSIDVMHEFAQNDGYTITPKVLDHIISIREYFQKFSITPSTSQFSNFVNLDVSDLLNEYQGSPIQRFAKYAGIPALEQDW